MVYFPVSVEPAPLAQASVDKAGFLFDMAAFVPAPSTPWSFAEGPTARVDPTGCQVLVQLLALPGELLSALLSCVQM